MPYIILVRLRSGVVAKSDDRQKTRYSSLYLFFGRRLAIALQQYLHFNHEYVSTSPPSILTSRALGNTVPPLTLSEKYLNIFLLGTVTNILISFYKIFYPIEYRASLPSIKCRGAQRYVVYLG